MRWLAVVVAGDVVLFSLISLVAYGIDKRRAERGRRRVPETTLHGLALLGGWPGALWGSRVFRHKTRKRSFRLVRGLCIVVHVGTVAGLAWFISR